MTENNVTARAAARPLTTVQDLNTVAEYCDYYGVPTLHPLVSVADFADFTPRPHLLRRMGFYCIFLKEQYCGEMVYGRTKYDYQAGTLICSAPGQVIGVADGKVPVNPKGLALIFHPDLLYGTPLARQMRGFTFFKYESNEALHMSDREREIVKNCMLGIKDELEHGIDKHTKRIVAASIETLLNHCVRFYDRQFVTREATNRHVIDNLEETLRNYFDSELPAKLGLPTVRYCAGKVFLSPNYFGDLVKRETGKTAQEFIQLATLGRAKELLADTRLTVSEVAWQLGFKYPNHLNRLFKKYTGVAPSAYRTQAV